MKKDKKRTKEKKPKGNVLEINLLKLEQEWVHHPRLMEKYSSKLSEARLNFKEMKAASEVYSAELYLKIRMENDQNDTKVTETTIKSLIIRDKGMRAHNNQLIQLEYKIDILQGMVASIVDKRRALERLVELHGQQYFSAPRSPKNDREYGDEVNKKAARKSYDI